MTGDFSYAPDEEKVRDDDDDVRLIDRTRPRRDAICVVFLRVIRGAMQYVYQTTPMLRREVFHEVRDVARRGGGGRGRGMMD